MLWLPLCRVCRVGVDGSAPEQTPTLQDWRSSQGAPLAGWLQLPGSSCLSSRRDEIQQRLGNRVPDTCLIMHASAARRSRAEECYPLIPLAVKMPHHNVLPAAH